MSRRIVDLVKGRAQEDSGPNPLDRVQQVLHRELIDAIDLSALEGMSPQETRSHLRVALNQLIRNHSVVMSSEQQEALFVRVLDDVMGFGPLERLLQMEGVSDILVNGPKDVWIERNGQLERTHVDFRDDDHLLHIIRRVVSSVGRRVDEASPLVDARLADGTRVNAVIPPITLDGPSLSLRRFSAKPLSRDDLVRFGSAPPEVFELLESCVHAGMNLLISGGTGTGKTTLLNVMSGFIPHSERIVTIEDAAELRLQQPHVVRMETRPANLEGRGEVTPRMLVKNALRMRPDRIVVGEIRGEEAVDLLQAMNTGHDGSMGTVHANSPAHAISRLKTMVAITIGNLPDKAIAEMLADALQLIVQVRRGLDGKRRIVSVAEVAGRDGEDVQLSEIVHFDQTGVDEDGTVHGRWIAPNEPVLSADIAKAHGRTLPDLRGLGVEA